MEELDYEKWYRAYSPNGGKSAVGPQVLFEILVYGYLCGIHSSRKLEEACRYRIDFLWLLGDAPAPDHTAIARFRTGRCQGALEELFYQLASKLEAMGETDRQAVFIDSAKLESRAGRYRFVWRKSVEKHPAAVKKQVYRETGLTNLIALREHLCAAAEGIVFVHVFVHGRGKRKGDAQHRWEQLQGLLERWTAYEEPLAIMGEGRGSYANTDHDATFMRMKEDYMRNGRLKPGYNVVQIAVNSEYITGIEAFSDRSDVRTLKPFLQRLEHFQQARYKEVVADAGYENLDNYLYLDAAGQSCFIKPANYDQKKSRKFQKQIGRIENMAYDPQEDCFTCAQGRRLSLYREHTEQKKGRLVSTAWYRYEDCSGCPCRSQCCRAKGSQQLKQLRLQKTFWEKRMQTQQRIASPRGIHLRLCRSIQVEGALGLLKNDFAFRRFLTRGRANIRAELFLPAMAFDLKKLWMKREQGRLKTRVSAKLTA